jgi:homeodomain-containing protein
MATRPAARSAQATRREMLLETLALRHQFCVLARSIRRFHPVDRLFWLFLRWLWPRWRDALVLIKPATVDRWHREGIRQCWRRRSRRPGRPRIDSTCRDLIRRMATENCLWGAPRIHGELLKLGITISERTVSRYLRGRQTTRSQTWRTFLANTFGTQTFISPMMFEDADDEETRVDASDEAPRPAQSIDVSRQSIHGRTIDLAHSRRPSTIGIGLAQRHPRKGARTSNCRDPPRDLHRGQPRGVCIGLFCLMRINLTSHRNPRQCEEISRTHPRLLQLQLPLDEQSCRQRLRTPDKFVQSATGCDVTCTI